VLHHPCARHFLLFPQLLGFHLNKSDKLRFFKALFCSRLIVDSKADGSSQFIEVSGLTELDKN